MSDDQHSANAPLIAGSRGRTILLTGASGYVGGRLLSRLERAGHQVRCLARRPEFMARRAGPETEVLQGDVLRPETLGPALAGVDTAYYLIHAMGCTDRKRFETQDREAARNFAQAARAAGVRQIIYLGGLGEDGDELSAHLRSRHEVGRILRESGSRVIEFRASVVIGSGSLSFEMLSALVERLPVMITPRWVHVLAQPIAIADLLDYLEAALELEGSDDRVYEIGGSERMTYGDLMHAYARQRGLRRVMLPVPVLTPRLSSLWLGLVTPLYARVGQVLVESITHETIVRNDLAQRDFAIEPMGATQAIEAALNNEDQEFAETRWSDALSSGGTEPEALGGYGGTRRGRRLLDTRDCEVTASPSNAFASIQCMGGETGWYGVNWLWRVRGFFDLLVGGVGARRGRVHPTDVAVGDAIDWWRVVRFEPGRLLRLRAEMRLPGRAWLEFEVEPTLTGSRIRQTAAFDPSGLGGLIYWYGIYPLHATTFRSMLAGIAEEALRRERADAELESKGGRPREAQKVPG